MKRIHFIWLLILIITASCDRDSGSNCTRTLGDEITEIRYPGTFSRIYAADKININYRYADTCYVEVTYGKNIIGQIETSVSLSTLTIADNSTCNFIRSLSIVPEVTVFAPTLNNIDNQSSGDITTLDTLKSNFFQYEQFKANGEIKLILLTDTAQIYIHTGYSGVTVKGKTYKAALYNRSSGKLDAHEFKAENTFVNNSSIQDIHCVAGNYLYGEINLSGNIYYSGDPVQVETNIFGTGTVAPE